MADFSADIKVSGPINLDGFSVNAYRRIMAFIEQIKAEENGARNIVKEESVPLTVSESAPDEAYKGNNVETPEEVRRRLETMPRFSGKEEFVKILLDFLEHLEDYETKSMLATEFIESYSSLKEVDSSSMGQMLGWCVRNLKCVAKDFERIKSENAIRNYYFLPVRKSKPSGFPVQKINPVDVKRGHLLRKARMEGGFSISEVASGIGYDTKIISNWETGVYHMAETAIKAICAFFKKDIFAGAEEASA